MATTLRMSQEEYDALTAKRSGATKGSKFRNRPTVDEDGVRHDSKKEARIWRDLRARLRAGEFRWLARQVEFILPGGIIYRADFVIGVRSAMIVMDAKGFRTDSYKLKRRLMAEAGYPIEEL